MIREPEAEMGMIETFDHTADVGLRVEGESLDDLFATAARGIFDYIVVNAEAVRPDRVEEAELSAASAEDLLITWLNELIFRCETAHRLYRDFEVRVAPDGRSLSARFAGEPIDRDRHELDHEVKAATYHGASLRREGDRWRAELILDI